MSQPAQLPISICLAIHPASNSFHKQPAQLLALHYRSYRTCGGGGGSSAGDKWGRRRLPRGQRHRHELSRQASQQAWPQASLACSGRAGLGWPASSIVASATSVQGSRMINFLWQKPMLLDFIGTVGQIMLSCHALPANSRFLCCGGDRKQNLLHWMEWAMEPLAFTLPRTLLIASAQPLLLFCASVTKLVGQNLQAREPNYPSAIAKSRSLMDAQMATHGISEKTCDDLDIQGSRTCSAGGHGPSALSLYSSSGECELQSHMVEGRCLRVSQIHIQSRQDSIRMSNMVTPHHGHLPSCNASLFLVFF